MTHAERLRAFADELQLCNSPQHADACLAGAAAIEALTPRRITSDPATWPGEGERVAWYVDGTPDFIDSMRPEYVGGWLYI